MISPESKCERCILFKYTLSKEEKANEGNVCEKINNILNKKLFDFMLTKDFPKLHDVEYKRVTKITGKRVFYLYAKFS